MECCFAGTSGAEAELEPSPGSRVVSKRGIRVHGIQARCPCEERQNRGCDGRAHNHAHCGIVLEGQPHFSLNLLEHGVIGYGFAKNNAVACASVPVRSTMAPFFASVYPFPAPLRTARNMRTQRPHTTAAQMYKAERVSRKRAQAPLAPETLCRHQLGVTSLSTPHFGAMNSEYRTTWRT